MSQKRSTTTSYKLRDIISRFIYMTRAIELERVSKDCVTQLAFTCTNLTIETLEQGVKYVQN